MSDKDKYYLNQAQQFIHTINPNSLTVIAGRRFGKSYGINAPRTLQRVQKMPRSTGFFYAETFKQALSRTLPTTLAALNAIGYIEDKHYFVGRRAPKFMNFELPYIAPKDWSHVVHFYNGSIIHILSQDVKFSANSLTTDWGFIDEARGIKKEKLFEEVVPTLSGTPGKFEGCHLKKGYDVVSDMPFSKDGSWILDQQKKMDVDLFEGIKGLIAEINRLKKAAGSRPSIYYQKEISSNTRLLNELRGHLHMYVEYDTLENLEVVRPEYIAQQKRELAPITFQISIMNKKRTKNEQGFYPNLNPDIHYYNSYDNNYIDNLRTTRGTYDLKKISQKDCLHDGDIDSEQPLYIAFDYNANINWVVTGQPIGEEMRTLSSFYTKHSRKLRALLEEWATYYKLHLTRDVIVYYDSTALDSAYADEYAESFIDIIYNELTAKGWTVVPVYVGQQMKHNLKHQYIDDALTGRKYLFPRFNKNNNKDLLPALEMAGVRSGRNGFEKDKSGEKLAETEDDPLEYRTDGTDAWDTLFVGLNFFPQQSGTSYLPTHFG